MLQAAKALTDEFGKPVILRTGYFNVKHAWKGESFYSISAVSGITGPEADLAASKYEFNTHDLARAIHAQFQAIAESLWVVGYLHFGYTRWEDPRSPWMAVRGKPAEDIWRKWNEGIYGVP